MNRIELGTQEKAKVSTTDIWTHSTFSKTNLENFDITEKLIFLGTEYGGWPILKNHLNENSICYCAGAGRDISFEEKLYSLYGCEIYTFEPTPSHFKFVNSRLRDLKYNDKIKTFEIGLDAEDIEMTFYPNGGHDSWSAYRKISSSDIERAIKVQMKKLSTLMNENNHKKLDVFKMDIEGSEYGVIDDIVENNLDIDMIAVEMHGDFIKSFNYSDRTNIADKKMYKEYMEKLYDCGYDIVWQLGYREHLLIKRELIK